MQFAVGRDGVVVRTDDGGVGPVGVDVLSSPESFALASFPNPFRATATIRYSLEQQLPVRLTVVDVTGRVVANLLDAPGTAGAHTLVWDGCDASGAAVRAGVYFVKMQAGASVTSTKVLRVE